MGSEYPNSDVIDTSAISIISVHSSKLYCGYFLMNISFYVVDAKKFNLKLQNDYDENSLRPDFGACKASFSQAT